MTFRSSAVATTLCFIVLTGCGPPAAGRAFFSEWRPTDAQIDRVDAAIDRFEARYPSKVFGPVRAFERVYFGVKEDGDPMIYVTVTDLRPSFQMPNTQYRAATQAGPRGSCMRYQIRYRPETDSVMGEECRVERQAD